MQHLRTGGLVVAGVLLLTLRSGFSARSSAIWSSSPAAALALARKLTTTALINRHAKTVSYTSARGEFVALGSPPGSPDETWNIAGLVNPTVVIRRGARVTVDFFNADTDQKTLHGWLLTTTQPPYPRNGLTETPLAFPGAVAAAIHGITAHKWLAETIHFTASRAGTYYYICPVPGHAQKGMYGKLVVK